MIADGFICIDSQRLIAFYILFNLYKFDNTIGSSSSLSSSSILTPPTTTTTTHHSSTLTVENNTDLNEDTSPSISPAVTSPLITPSTSNTINTSVSDLPISYNPFLPIFIDELEKHFKSNNSSSSNHNSHRYGNYNIESIEKQYLIQLLTNQLPKDFSKKTVLEIINTQPPSTSNNSNEQQYSSIKINNIESLNEYKTFYLDRLPNHCFPSLRSIGISPILYINNDENNNNNDNQNKENNSSNSNKKQDKVENVEFTSNDLNLFSFEPNIKRPSPPIYDPLDTIWINLSINHTLLIGKGDVLTNNNNQYNAKKSIRDLMSKAMKGRLKRTQLQQFKTDIESDPTLIKYSGLTPKKLCNLVENNTQVAIDSLLKLIQYKDEFQQYFKELISMEMNYRSMEVVNSLATSSGVALVKQYIPMYISHCIATCNNIKDNTMQQRSVRLVCVFIQSLIRNSIIDIKDVALFTEVQKFCLEYSKIREAIGLFKFMIDDSSSNINTLTPPTSVSK
ncbi:hypothetical protein CYY_001794 [Polysphondylium violaceum]|uniref:CCR4-NOT transcription complex subunit 11 n=1 Tax=Polysphondylium violaceum TaxID=133409 RepID=A0A8J4UVU1_9MYCE|nr:hypothetical protein CYY_001794 [Polysphondylium violaceum]